MEERADPGEVTALLKRMRVSSADAVDELLPLVYGELRRLARARLRGERPDHTFSPTDLVHEAYLELVDQRDATWKDRTHFFATAATAMRRILIDHARAKRTQKRGGEVVMVTLGGTGAEQSRELDELIALDEALEELAALDGRQAKMVEYRYFVGLKDTEIADALGISVATVERDWRSARAWLHSRLAS